MHEAMAAGSELARSWLNGKAPRNVWVGTTVEDQTRADERIPELLGIPARVRFLSCEPLLGRVDLWGTGATSPELGIHWVIAGGESGPGARPMQEDWASSLKHQCSAAGIAFFMKQMGGARDKRAELPDIPEDLRLRDFPHA